MRARTAAAARPARRGGLRPLLGPLLAPVPGLGRRPATLAATGALALVGGLAAGFGADLLTEPAPPQAVATGPADECPVMQAAWSRSATLQLAMSADDPVALRRGFVGARDALADVHPPEGVADDWQTVAAYVGAVADEIEDAADDEVPSRVAATLPGLDADAMSAASERVTRYLKGGCADASEAPPG